jgi:hypothetical protein
LLIYESEQFDSQTHTLLPIFKSFHTTNFHRDIHPALVSCPSCVDEKVGVNQKGINKKITIPSEIKG